VGSGPVTGLAVSRGIAEAHGGSLALADTSGDGTCFVLRLPQAEPEDAAASAPRPVQAAVAAMASRRALVVDDEPELAAILVEILVPLGFCCDLAATGRQAQHLLSDRDYDVILCDLRMPETDGLALYRWLEMNRPRLCARIAFVTGDTLGQGAAVFLAQSGRPMLEKPFLPENVRRLTSSLSTG
jgi:CheY-like chemotaxis protein